MPLIRRRSALLAIKVVMVGHFRTASCTTRTGQRVVVGGASNPGTQTRVLNNKIAESGFQGILGNVNTNTLIQGNEIFWNNTEGFFLDWAGGGVKLTGMTNATLDTNVVHDNQGPGLWCDQNCRNITFSSNRVYYNAGHRRTRPRRKPTDLLRDQRRCAHSRQCRLGRDWLLARHLHLELGQRGGPVERRRLVRPRTHGLPADSVLHPTRGRNKRLLPRQCDRDGPTW